jgi:phosphohistidine phosphatase SixA
MIRSSRWVRVSEVQMKLYFLRHGLAGERTEWIGDDEDRPLTEAGVAQTSREAAGLRVYPRTGSG